MEENKLIYMDIFQDYVCIIKVMIQYLMTNICYQLQAQLVETFLEQKLRKIFPLFSMEEFLKELK